jgi:signal peptidase II
VSSEQTSEQTGDTAGPAAIAEPAAEPAEPAGRGRLPLLLAVAAVVVGLDLLTKAIVVATMTPDRPIRVVGDFVTLRLIRNSGAAFSMATGMTWLLALIAIAVAVGVIRFGRTLRSLWWGLGLGLVLGGTLGNLIDRFFRAPGPLRGHVVDFIAVGHWWPVFNLADSAICCGAAVLVSLTVFGFEPDGSRARR